MGRLAHRKLALGIGGGIAAYKACDLVRELRREGAEVRVVMTPAATQFVTPLTLEALSGHPVATDYFLPEQERAFGHLDLARWADAFVVAPATADVLARLAAGLANDALLTTLCAFRGPVLLAPAMNTGMWEQAQTQENVAALRQNPRFSWVGPESGLLADGDVGPGRLAALPELVAAAVALAVRGPLAGAKVLINAGPTREFADPVRFLSNPSTGKMGFRMAEVARQRGAQVTLVCGPVPQKPSLAVEWVDVVSAEDMAEACLSRTEWADAFVATAAVSDWRPRVREAQKRKKSDDSGVLELEPTRDILKTFAAAVRGGPRRVFLVGFAAETEQVEAHGREKLKAKQLDMLVANDVTAPGAGFGTETNRVWVLSPDGGVLCLEGDKRVVAEGIWDRVQQGMGRA